MSWAYRKSTSGRGARAVWIRRSAVDPWVIDLPITPDRDGLWTSKRDPDHVAPLGEVTWVADDGIRYLLYPDHAWRVRLT